MCAIPDVYLDTEGKVYHGIINYKRWPLSPPNQSSGLGSSHGKSQQADATKFSETGIVGEDAEDVVRQLVDAAGGSSAVAGYGMVHLA